MAEWSKNKVDPSSLNNGQEYTKNDNVSLEELNSIVNNSLYASEVADTANTNSENAIATANEALEQARSTGTRVTKGGEFQATFDADTKLDKSQGAGNSNKVIVTDEQGEIKPADEISIQKITLGSVVITPIVDAETGESGIRFSIPETTSEEGGSE